MAILKIKARKSNLKQLIDYIRNGTKTEQHHFESVWNLRSADTAYDEMMFTKERLGKKGGTQAFHFIQSFKPDEITPEKANEVGREFARRLLGNEYEAIITTHTDHQHIHNHVCVNSVNRINGKKYHSSIQDMKRYRALSDEICREYGLSIIEPQGKGKHYAEWNAEQQGKPTIASLIRKDINWAIRHSIGFGDFLSKLEDIGYQTKQGKVWSIKPPFSDRFRRLDNLGDLFTQEAIERRIDESFRVPAPPKIYPKKTYAENIDYYADYGFWKGLVILIVDTFEPRPQYHYKDTTVELAEALADLTFMVFAIFLDLLLGAKLEIIPKEYATQFHKETTKFDKYVAQYEFIAKNHLNTTDDIWDLHSKTCIKIGDLTTERENKEIAPERRKEINAELKDLRKTKKSCENIIATTGDIFVKIKRIAIIELEKENEKTKKKKRDDYER